MKQHQVKTGRRVTPGDRNTCFDDAKCFGHLCFDARCFGHLCFDARCFGHLCFDARCFSTCAWARLSQIFATRIPKAT